MRKNFICVVSGLLLCYQCVEDVRLSLHFVGVILFCSQCGHGDDINACRKPRSVVTVCVCVSSHCVFIMLSVCVDDVRVWGRPLPLPPAANTTRWGHVTSWQGLEADCSDGDACINTTCVAPFTCFSTWRAATCRY